MAHKKGLGSSRNGRDSGFSLMALRFTVVRQSELARLSFVSVVLITLGVTLVAARIDTLFCTLRWRCWKFRRVASTSLTSLLLRHKFS